MISGGFEGCLRQELRGEQVQCSAIEGDAIDRPANLCVGPESTGNLPAGVRPWTGLGGSGTVPRARDDSEGGRGQIGVRDMIRIRAMCLWGKQSDKHWES